MELAHFDRTARGRLIVGGHDRKDLLHRLATHDLLALSAGQGRAVCFCNAKGRLIDWTVALDRGDDLLLLTGNPERLSGHIQQYTITEDVTVRNYIAVELVVCGPGARGFLEVNLDPWCHTTRRLGEVEVLIARVEPLLGEAYVVLAPDAVALRRVLAERGRALSPEQVDELRIRAGIPAHPAEINEEHNPWEAALDASVSLHKGCYVGQEVIARLKTYDKVQRKLRRLDLDGPRSPGGTVTRDGSEVATLTTVVGARGLAYVDVEHAAPGTALDGARVVPFDGE